MNPKQEYIVTIGASMGGIKAVSSLLAQLPTTFPAPILVVIHLHDRSPAILDSLLSKNTNLKVKFAAHKEPIQAGVVYLAPPDYHLLVKDGIVLLSHGPRENRSRPAIDPLFRSAAVSHDSRVIGIILTGLLDDGTDGLRAIKECGGVTIVQNPKDAEYKEMPRNAIESLEIDCIATLAEMGNLLMCFTQNELPAPGFVPHYLKLENEISQGLIRPDVKDNIIGELVPVVCPDCGGTLSEMQYGNNYHYRCHEGHAFGQLSLIDAQDKKIEYALWAAVRILDEQANMLAKMARREEKISPHRENRFAIRSQEIRAYAQNIRDFLLHIGRKIE